VDSGGPYSLSSKIGVTKQVTDMDDLGNESEVERSCLLDESVLKKQLFMPNV